ncbi:MAG: helix-turn-helix transcriptional regulator, partial [Bacteroidota bacterium]
EQFVAHKSLDFYTLALQMTSRKLNEVLKEVLGQTANQYIIGRTMTEAKRELCFTERSIKEIVIALGYDNQYYFSRIFKKRIGLSPEQFRTQFAQ